MGGDSHGHDQFKVPDYKTYKVCDAPELLRTQKELAARGLKDPWLRNEVWRFDPKLWGTEASRVKATFSRGLVLGVGGFVVTVAASTLYNKMFPSDHHDHGDSH